jgi:uncharacterized protein (TIGR00251 family)
MSEHVTLRLRILPGARRNEVIGWYGGAVKVRCQAPALDGRANEAVIGFLADIVGLRRSDVVIVNGLRSREKVIEFRGLRADELYARLGLTAPEPDS